MRVRRWRGRRWTATASALVLALLAAGVAQAAHVGANDDTPKFSEDGGDGFYGRMREAGLQQIVLTVRWTPSAPLEIPGREGLDRAVAQAQAQGVAVVFAVYPYPPSELQQGLGTPEGFAAWLTALAAAYPTVKQYVVGNEPNQPAFLRPQFDAAGVNVSAARAGEFLAAGYDALKASDPAIVVVGIGLSPRGNDRPKAQSNISTSPVRFVAALGAWYRASGRRLPLMDGFSFHPYPNVATDPLDRGYAWPNAGFVNLDRLKQALWDAFAGTAQPTTVTGLKLYLDEVGWQVDTAALAGYTGTENVPVTTEEAQGALYGELVRRAMCDPDIAQVNIFGFYDDRERAGFQAALYRAEGTPRPAAAAVTAALTASACDTAAAPWAPAAGVAGAGQPPLRWKDGRLSMTIRVAEGATALACVLPGRVSPTTARYVLAAGPVGDACEKVALVAHARAKLAVPLPAAGPYTVALRIAAETSPRRATTFAFSGRRPLDRRTGVRVRSNTCSDTASPHASSC